MTEITKRHVVKVPLNISLYYCDKSQIIVFSSLLKRRSLKLKTKIIVDKTKKNIKVTQEPFFSVSNSDRKKLKILQATYVVLLKQLILDVSTSFCKRLVLVGVGYKIILLQILNTAVLHLKLGYSHHIYFKIPKNLKVFCLKGNKFFIKGDSYTFVTQIAAIIRSYKTPEPYKGKGILYATEKITLKEGKKI